MNRQTNGGSKAVRTKSPAWAQRPKRGLMVRSSLVIDESVFMIGARVYI